MRFSTNVHIFAESGIELETFPPGDGNNAFAAVRITGNTGFVNLILRDVADVERLVAKVQEAGNWLARATVARARPGACCFVGCELPATHWIGKAGNYSETFACDGHVSSLIGLDEEAVPLSAKEPSFVREDRNGKLHFDDAADAEFRRGIEAGPDDVPAPPQKKCNLCFADVEPGLSHCSACLADVPF